VSISGKGSIANAEFGKTEAVIELLAPPLLCAEHLEANNSILERTMLDMDKAILLLYGIDPEESFCLVAGR